MKLIAKDLMVGDWVFVSEKPYKIIAIRNDNFSKHRIQIDNEFQTWQREETVEPNPISQEILEKNGFVNMGFFGKLEIGKFVVICDTNNLTILRDGHCDLEIPIKFVHELQHALKLCGIEKEIVL